MPSLATHDQIEEVCRSNSVHTSLAFPALLRSCSGKRARILDLGRLCEQNISALYPYASKIYLEDLVSTLSDNPGMALPPSYFDGLRALSKERPIDLILCWDILNYFSGPELKEFGDAVSGCSHSGTKLFLIRPTAKFMATRPYFFKFLTPEKLLYMPMGGEMVERAAPKKTELQRAMPQFYRQRSFLLRNGFEEHILQSTLGKIERPAQLSSVA